MKKLSLLTLLLGLFGFVIAQPHISNLSYPATADLFGMYEITFSMDAYSNPYDPEIIDVYAEFIGPNGRSYKVNGFYYEGYRFEQHKSYEKSQPDNRNNGWRVRFTPDQVGVWHFTLRATDKKGTAMMPSDASKAMQFKCANVKQGQGFISKANSRYLKRDVVTNGQRSYHSFFPIGPNVAWYTCKSYYDFATAYGIYEYERRIDSLAGSANYMRVWINRPQYLSLYGQEFTQVVNGKATIYFDNKINQKDAAQLDHIIAYAAQNGITVMPCFFNYKDFMIDHDNGDDLVKYPDDWRLNPFHTILGLKVPVDFFTDPKARHITKNLIRYIVARWGYATNIIAWELWNESANMDNSDQDIGHFRSAVLDWHDEMATYIRSIDPFGHMVTTSLGNSDAEGYLEKRVFKTLDIVQYHKYFNILKAKSLETPSYQLLLRSNSTHAMYPTKPLFIGEFGFGKQNASKYLAQDPYNIDLHNTLWSTLFSGAMGPASFWLWQALDKCGTHAAFKPLLTFCSDLPIPSETFAPRTTGKPSQTSKSALVFPNSIETYYMVNHAEDSIYGWCQDTAFSYQALRRLTDKVNKRIHFEEDAVIDPKGYLYTLNIHKRPKPSSRSNTITLPITRQPAGAAYVVRWYDTETGLEITEERTTAIVKKPLFGGDRFLSFEFPSSVRDLKRKTINNHFGDAVFRIVLNRDGKTLSTKQ